MIPSSKFYDKLTEYEGNEYKAYRDTAGIPTIGRGTIKYPNGKSVKKGDTCTEEQSMEWAKYEAEQKAKTLSGLLINTPVNQNQFDAMLLLVYNIGAGGFAASTVLKKIKANASRFEIEKAWLMWNKVRNPTTKELEPSKGLTTRRKKELALYFS